MGVKGLQSFMDSCCPEACVTVNLREMAKQHSVSQRVPTLVVDGMACLRQWYSCKDWVSGGQWKEYMDILKRWVEVFNLAGIRLVFFFDGVVEEQKRQTWIKRRRRVNGDVRKIFSHIKSYGEQPVGNMFVLPSGLATFTCFALKSLKQEVFCSMREADFEISSYARENNCMGILGQDTDFIIFDSAPYLSCSKLRMGTLTTVLYDRHRLCETLGLAVHQLPLLACLLGNDVVSEERMQHIRKDALEIYRQFNSSPQDGEMIFAVSQFMRSWSESHKGVFPPTFKLSAANKELLEKGIHSYLLPDQKKHQSSEIIDHPAAVYQKYVSPTILQACREKHAAAEGFMVFSVVSEGVVECSNSLEDEEDTELLPQALVYKPCRQRMYGLLLMHKGTEGNPPAIKEWFVFPGNPLKEPEMVPPIPINLQSDPPSLDLLWFGKSPEVSSLRLSSFLAILDCQDLSELYGTIEEHIFITVCLVTYIVIQVQTLSQEDVDAYLSQALCLAQKSSQELQEIKLPFLCSRVVQLGCLFVRGLGFLLGANCASGCPFTTDALMPWKSFDGRLFHSKYLQAHSSLQDVELLDNDASLLNIFHRLRAKVKEVSLNKGRELQSRPRRHTPQFTHKPRGEPRYRGPHRGGQGWRNRSEPRGGHQNADGQWGQGETRRQPHHSEARGQHHYEARGQHHYEDRGQHHYEDRGQHHYEDRGQHHYEDRGQHHYEARGQHHYEARGQHHYEDRGQHHHDDQQHHRGALANRRGRYNHKGRYNLAPRWSQPPGP